MTEQDDKINAIHQDVAYIKAKIEDLPDHESRIRSLERFRYTFPSVAIIGLVVALTGVALNHL